MNRDMVPRLQGSIVGGLICFIILFVHGVTRAATFCVSTPAALGAALLTAESNGEDDVVRLVQGTYTGGFVYSAAEARDLTIEGGYVAGCASRVVNPANTVLDGLGTTTVLVLVSTRSANFRVQGITLQNGAATNGSGGGLFATTNEGTLTLSSNRIASNTASGEGVGVWASGHTTATLTSNTISTNIGSFYWNGWAWVLSHMVFISGGTATLSNNTISANIGGGVSLSSTTATLSNNTISANTGGEGVGALLSSTTATLSNNTISANTGRGVVISGGTAALTGNTISANTGSGVSIWSTTATLTGNTIAANTTSGDSGGVSLSSITATLTNNVIAGNTASGAGGGVSLSSTTATLTNNVIAGNTASGDSGGVSLSSTTATLTNNVIAGNTASGAGGGVLIWSGTGTLTNNTITDNRANVGGGVWFGLQNDSDRANIYNNLIWRNSAVQQGADLYLNNDGDGNFVRSPVSLYHNDFDKTAGIFIRLPFAIDASNLDNRNPLFVDTASGDYHVQEGSPVIDSGNNAAPALPLTDKDGNPRLVGAAVDMGAFEFQDGVSFPDIDVEPSSLAFGGVQVGACSNRQLTITNLGTAPLGVSSVLSDTPEMTVVSPSFPQLVAPQGSLVVSAAFCPLTVGACSGSFAIRSNDPDDPEVTVLASGMGLDTLLPCDADADGDVDFGDARAVLRFLLRQVPLAGDGDCNADGRVDLRDVMAIIGLSR